MSEPILAQYTIRSKQDYIFRTNRLLEIVGASAIIANSFDLLFACAEQCGLRTSREKGEFHMAETLQAFENGALDMSELFIGGGNDTVLFKDRETCRKVNERFSYRLLKEYPGLLPMYVGVPIKEKEGAYQYREDYARLMAAADIEKNRMAPSRGRYALPFARTDRSTFQPLAIKTSREGEERWLSDEAYAKFRFGMADEKNADDSRYLDRLTTEHGEESLLAIVHADGNNMGAKIQKKLGGNTDYDTCVTVMRRFTKDIDAAFSKHGREALEKRREELKRAYPQLKDRSFAVRWIVSDGDDATFICNARLARELTEAYLRGVAEYRSADDPQERYSSCAGICIFHSHYPFARAYDLAEQACDNAKRPVHDSAVAADGSPQKPLEQAWLDFHYIHSGVGGDLDEIRSLHQTKNCMARPWLVCGDQGGGADKEIRKLDELARVLREGKVSRSNIKTLGAIYEADTAQGELEWDRICYHAKTIYGIADLDRRVKPLFSGRQDMMRAMYDLSEILDLWYRKGMA